VIFSDATLKDMARRRPRTRAEMLAVAGVGQVKYERYGEAFLAVFRDERRETKDERAREAPLRRPDGGLLTPSLRETLALRAEGLDLAQIAKARGLAGSTIATHLAELIHGGLIDDLSGLVEPGLIERVTEYAGDGRVGPLAALREALGGELPYEQLHLARAWVERRKTKD